MCTIVISSNAISPLKSHEFENRSLYTEAQSKPEEHVSRKDSLDSRTRQMSTLVSTQVRATFHFPDSVGLLTECCSKLFDTGRNSSRTSCACPRRSSTRFFYSVPLWSVRSVYNNAAKPIKPAPTRPIPDCTFKLPATFGVVLAAAPLADADALDAVDSAPEAELEPVVVAEAVVPEAVLLELAVPLEVAVEEQPAEAG